MTHYRLNKNPQKNYFKKIIGQIVMISKVCDQNADRMSRNNKVALLAVFDLNGSW